MKNASKTMFNIGNIFTIIYLILSILFIIIGIVTSVIGGIGVANNEEGAAALVASGGTLIGTGIYLLIASILCLIFVGKAKRELANETTRRPAPFIITIVFGAIDWNVFYVLAGIFGLIAEGQQGK